MEKDTSKLVEELKLCPDFSRFYDENREYMVTGTLAERLQELCRQKAISRGEAARRAEMSEDYGYQIFSGLRHPERNKLLALAVGMGLDLDEVQTLLKYAGYPTLVVRRPWDSVLIYGFCKGLTVSQINALLFRYGFDTLG
ncbi:MAG: helix-turn-helix domain-containing protein [Clostridia bacterium]|nr:helix-turn-helix domain-containing protein [Clostridia bacterium]